MKLAPITLLDTGAWASKGGFCIYVISTKISCTGRKRSISFLTQKGLIELRVFFFQKYVPKMLYIRIFNWSLWKKTLQKKAKSFSLK